MYLANNATEHFHSYSIAQRMLHLALQHNMTSIDHLDDADALEQILQELASFDSAKKIPAIHRAVLLQERAPRKQLLLALVHRNAAVRAAAADAIETLQQWITDEQWLEAMPKNSWQTFFAARDILATLGKNAPIGPLLR